MNSGTKTLAVIIMLIFVSSIIPQDKTKSESAEALTGKLKQKVLLNDDQVKEVTVILVDYQPDDAEKAKSVKQRIEDILDPKQKAKYDIIKEDWWREVDKALK